MQEEPIPVGHYVPLLEFNQRWRVPASQGRVQGRHKNIPAEHEFETACPGPIVFRSRKAVVGERPDRVESGNCSDLIFN
jgi:hypothetical protein